MKALFDAVAKVGASPADSRRLAKQIRASNIIGAGFALVSVPSFVWLGSHARAFMGFLVFALVGYLSPLVLNHLRFHRWARVMPLLMGSLVIAVVTVCLGLESHVHLCLFLMAALPFVVFDIRDVPLLVLLEAVPLGLLFTLLFFPVHAGPVVVFAPGALRPLAYLATLSAFVPTALLLAWFYFDNQRNEEELLATVARLNEEIGVRQGAEAKLVSALDAAEKGVRAKTEFVAIVSHELRTPLNGVMGMTTLLRGTPLDREQAEMVANIDTSGRFLLHLINDILDLSKLDAGGPLAHALFSPEQVLEETVVALSPLAGEKGLDLAFHFDGPPSACLQGDAARVRQVMTNFLGNALKFTEKGFVKVEARVFDDAEGRSRLRGEVIDTGVGVPVADRARIFEPFTQLDASLNRKRGGTGLGLAISRRLVLQMGGNLGVEGRPGGGSVFWFEVPLERAPCHAPAEPVLTGLKVVLHARSPVLGPVLRAWLVKAGATICDESSACSEPSVCLEPRLHLIDGFGYACAEVLALAAQAHARQGRVVVLSPEPKGKQDCLVLPRNVSRRVLLESLRQPEASRAGPVPVTGRHAAVQRNLRALVVEDNLVNQKVAVGLLKRLGVTAEVAENGKAGIEHWERGGYDFILMDLQMPVMDGLEAVQIIRARERASDRVVARLPIFALSANASAEDRAAASHVGMDGFLSKPLHADELRKLIDALPTTERPARTTGAVEAATEQASARCRSLN